MIKMKGRPLSANESRRGARDHAALQGQHAAPAVRLSKASDGLWYVDVRRTATGASCSDSRHASLDEALERMRAVAGRDLQRESAGCVG